MLEGLVVGSYENFLLSNRKWPILMNSAIHNVHRVRKWFPNKTEMQEQLTEKYKFNIDNTKI